MGGGSLKLASLITCLQMEGGLRTSTASLFGVVHDDFMNVLFVNWGALRPQRPSCFKAVHASFIDDDVFTWDGKPVLSCAWVLR